MQDRTLHVELLDVAALYLSDVKRDIIARIVEHGRVLGPALGQDLAMADLFLLTLLAYLLLLFKAVDGDAPQG